MAVIRWGREGDLLSQLSKMHEDMDRLVSSFGSRGGFNAQRPGVYPPLNVYQDDEGYIVRAELPGIDPSKLELEVSGDTLTVRGERELPEVPEGASYHRREREDGNFRRSLTLPEQVEASKVAATYNHGILDIRLPQAEAARSRKIEIKAR